MKKFLFTFLLFLILANVSFGCGETVVVVSNVGDGKVNKTFDEVRIYDLEGTL